MAYIKTDWVNDSTPLNAANMNHIEDGIEGAYNDIATKADAVAVEEALALKANIADVYNKNDTDALLATKANADDVYTKQESYNKTKVDELLAEKQNTLTFDTTPTAGSTNPVTSDGIYKAIDSATPHEGTITNDMLAGGITGDKLAQSTKDLFDAAGTADSAVGEHNVSNTAHADIRQEVASKADLSEVYTKSQSYSKTEVDDKIAGKQDTLTFDAVPTNGSSNPVTSDGIYDALLLKADAGDVSASLALKANKSEVNAALALKANLNDVYTKSQVYTKSEMDSALSGKQNTLTFDNAPINGSTNPVTSDGIYDALAVKANAATVNEALALKADADSVYTKQETYTQSQVGTLLNNGINTHNTSNTAHADIRETLSQKANSADVQNALALKANSADVYTKSEVYTQTETDNLLSAKANSADVYTKSETYTQTEVDTLLSAKANSTDVYTKTEADNLLDEKADITAIEQGLIIAGKAQTAQQIENVSPESGSTQTTPFRFEATGTDDNTTETPTAPIAKHLELRGNTVGWNQLIRNGNFASSSNWTALRCSLSVANNIATIAASENVTNMVLRQTTLATYLGHTYLAKFNIDTTNLSNLSQLLIVRYSSGVVPVQQFNIINSNVGYIVFTATTATTPQFGFYFSSPDNSTYLTGSADISSVQLFDLSEIYGAGKEPTGTDEEILQRFNRDFPLPYYEYNTGTLLSCQSNKLTTIGYNAFDGELEQGGIDVNGQPEVNANAVRGKNFIKVIAGQTYTLEETTAETVTPYVAEYDGNKNFIKVSEYTADITLTNDTHFVKFYFLSSSALIPANIESVVFNITWDNSRTGYEQYSKHEYTLPNVELRSAYNAYDEIKPDGTKITRVGSYTFTGRESYSYTRSATLRITLNFLDNLKLPLQQSGTISNTYVNGYLTIRNSDSYEYDNCIVSYVNADIPFMWFKNMSLFDPNKTDEENKQALIDDITGRTFYYELVIPTETQTTSFAENIEVDDFGTLEFESSATESSVNPIIPQGNKMFFPADYVLLLDDLNNYTDGDITKLAKKTDLSSYYTELEVDALLASKLTEPSSGIAAGKIFKVASIDADGHPVLEYANEPSIPVTVAESYTIATSDWTALSSSDPYTYSATVTATHTIGNDTIIELINNQPILFANHGFAVASVSGQVLTIYSIGVPDASVTLEVDYNG